MVGGAERSGLSEAVGDYFMPQAIGAIAAKRSKANITIESEAKT